MQIYPGIHKIIQTDKVNLDMEIPLAYINTELNDYDITQIAMPGFDVYSKTKAIPYEEVNSMGVKLYDEYGSSVPDLLQQNRDKVYYAPKNMTSFQPQRFNYSVVGKKVIRYKTDSSYNISVGCVDDPLTLSLSRSLIKVFGDAPSRNIAPQNIEVNSKDLSIQSLTQGSIEEKDFLFIESFDGLHYKFYWSENTAYALNETIEYNGARYICSTPHVSTSFQTDSANWRSVNTYVIGNYYNQNDYVCYLGEVYICLIAHSAIEFTESYWSKVVTADRVIDFDMFLDKHTNIWLSVDDYYLYGIKQQAATLTLKSPILFQTNSYTSSYVFDNDMVPYDKECTELRLFNEGQGNNLLLEYAKKGFVIVTHKSFLNSIEVNANLFYEIMSYVYFNTYLETAPINEWITDIVPDYVAVNNNLIQKDKFTSSMDLPKMFNMNTDEIILADIKIDAANVKFTSVANNYIIFQKSFTEEFQSYADPIKPIGNISIFTPRQDVIYYDKFVYKITDSIVKNTFITKQDEKYFLVNEAIKNSSNGIEIAPGATEIPLMTIVNNQQIAVGNVIMNVCCKENILNIEEENNYTPDKGIIIMKLKVGQSKQDAKVIDMRQRGGGLPEDEEDNYELLDIGNVLGRAYRPAGAVIITLPSRLKQYEDMILKALKKHMVAEEYPIILFKEDE